MFNKLFSSDKNDDDENNQNQVNTANGFVAAKSGNAMQDTIAQLHHQNSPTSNKNSIIHNNNNNNNNQGSSFYSSSSSPSSSPPPPLAPLFDIRQQQENHNNQDLTLFSLGLNPKTRNPLLVAGQDSKEYLLQLIKKYEEKTKTCAELQRNNQEDQEIISELKKKLDEAQKDIQFVNKQKKESSLETERLRKERNNWEKKCDETVSNCRALKCQVDNLLQEHKNLKIENAILQGKNNELEIKLKEQKDLRNKWSAAAATSSPVPSWANSSNKNFSSSSSNIIGASPSPRPQMMMANNNNKKNHQNNNNALHSSNKFEEMNEKYIAEKHEKEELKKEVHTLRKKLAFKNVESSQQEETNNKKSYSLLALLLFSSCMFCSFYSLSVVSRKRLYQNLYKLDDNNKEGKNNNNNQYYEMTSFLPQMLTNNLHPSLLIFVTSVFVFVLWSQAIPMFVHQLFTRLFDEKKFWNNNKNDDNKNKQE